MTLIEFLLARIAEDEEDIEDARIGDSPEWWEPTAWSRERSMLEIDIKKRIIAKCRWMDGAGWDFLRFLALPYRDHPDYQESWRVVPS